MANNTMMNSNFSIRDAEYYTELERKKEYNTTEWWSRLTDTQEDRTSNWDTPADIGWRIKSNDLPIAGTFTPMPQFKGDYFIDNKIKQANKWKTSLLLSGDVQIDVIPLSGMSNVRSELLESDLNRIFAQSGLQRKTREVVEDANYTAIGVCRLYWDTMDIDPQWLSGKPKIEYVDSRNIYYTTPDYDPYNIDSVWHVKRVDVNILKAIYGREFVADDSSIVGVQNTYNNYTATIVIHQYSKEVLTEKYEIIDRASGKSYVVTDKDIQKAKEDLVEEFGNFMTNGTVGVPYASDYIRNYLQTVTEEPSVESFTMYIETNGIYPEDFYESKPIKVKQTIWYEVRYLASEYNELLQKPTAIGYQSDYKFLFLGERQNGSAYPLSITYDLYPMQEQANLLMTIQTILAAKYNKPTPVLENGSLINQTEFEQNYWKLGFVAKVSEAWRQEHPNTEAIKWELPPQNMNMPLQLFQMTSEAIKTASGAIDEARGQQRFSGQSGVSIGRLQSASKSYVQIDIEAYRDFLEDIVYWIKDAIIRFKTYPFKVELPAMDNETGVREEEVNTNLDNTLDIDNYICRVLFTALPEDNQLAKQQEAIQLFQLGLMGKYDTLNSANVENASRVYQNKLKEDEIMQLGMLLQQVQETNPEVVAQLQQSIQKNSGNTSK